MNKRKKEKWAYLKEEEWYGKTNDNRSKSKIHVV